MGSIIQGQGKANVLALVCKKAILDFARAHFIPLSIGRVGEKSE